MWIVSWRVRQRRRLADDHILSDLAEGVIASVHVFQKLMREAGLNVASRVFPGKEFRIYRAKSPKHAKKSFSSLTLAPFAPLREL